MPEGGSDNPRCTETTAKLRCNRRHLPNDHRLSITVRWLRPGCHRFLKSRRHRPRIMVDAVPRGARHELLGNGAALRRASEARAQQIAFAGFPGLAPDLGQLRSSVASSSPGAGGGNGPAWRQRPRRGTMAKCLDDGGMLLLTRMSVVVAHGRVESGARRIARCAVSQRPDDVTDRLVARCRGDQHGNSWSNAVIWSIAHRLGP